MSRILGAPTKFAFCAMNAQSPKLALADTYLSTLMPSASAITAPAVVQDEDFRFVTPGTTFYGTLSPSGDDDLLSLAVTAGETYTVSLRGVGQSGVGDTLLGVLDENGEVFAIDDDGGIGIYSLITFTATTTGTYYVYANSFDEGGTGDYRVDVAQESATPDVGDTFAGAQAINFDSLVIGFIGDQTGPYEGLGDVDTYKVTLEAGKYYTFQLAGGADYDTDSLDVPTGELDTVILIYNAAGDLVAANDDLNFPSDISSGTGFLATQSGTYYIDVTAYAGQRGGYTLVAQEVELASLDPLDSIRWVNAANIPTVNNVATVYFAAAGDSLGELADDGVSPLIAYGWNDYEKQQVMAALAEYTTITGITYEITTDASTATFRLQTTTSTEYGAYFYPRDPSYGTQQGIGVFNVVSGGWNLPGQASLAQGGYAFGVILHEFGHAHGLAHPHDNGGGSDVMIGVTGPDALGIYDLNQGVYTVMSYNDAWETHPDGESPYTRATVGFGWSGGLSAFDIAALQERYGVHAAATGNTVYTLKDANAPGTFYEAIWDTGGVDEIRYDGARNARIDLLAATLDYTPTGGGVVSFVDDIFGGYTIANGVVIENATGGAGNDVLLGNAAANVLLGNAGADTLIGRGGNDTLDGGLGNDTLDGGDGDDRVIYDPIDGRVVGGDGNDTLVVRGAVTVNLANASTSQIEGKSVSGFENVDAATAVSAVTLIGSDFGNRLIGGAYGDVISGGAGGDYLTGNGGDDILDGGADADRVEGGGGNDRIIYDGNDYSISGDEGDDTLVLNGAAAVNLGNFSTSQVAGKSVWGFENVDASGSAAAVTLTGSAFSNRLTGGSGNDVISAGAGFDIVIGGAGDDTLDGGADVDRIEGGAGNDRIVYDAADSYVSGDAGEDTLVLAGAVNVNLGTFGATQIAGKQVFAFENVDASAVSARVTLAGSDGSNRLIGGAGNDLIQGGGGSDTLDGGLGGDRLEGGAGNDRIVYDAADTGVYGDAGDDTLVLRSGATVNLANYTTSQIAGKSVWSFENVDASGSTAAVDLTGSVFNNVLVGGSGNDTLRGGGGFDSLSGGGGVDRFVFDTLASAATGRTTIRDFTYGEKIDLSGIDAISGGGDDAFSFIGNAAFSNVAGQLRYSAGDGGQIVQGDVNGDGVADFSILVLASTIQSGYFLL